MSFSESDTLELLCLDVIISNFDRFCASFCSEENNLKFHLEFIQRRWSSRILQKLFEKCLLKDEHLQIVINKYTKELDFQTVLHCEGETVIHRLKEIGNVIEKVSLKDVPVFFNLNSVWNYLFNVQTVDLQHTNCTNVTLSLISENCPHLKNLNLFGCSKVNDVGLIHLINYKLSLESLNVEGTGVTYKGLASVLKNIPSLQKLWHGNVPRAIFEILGLNDSLGTATTDKIFNLNNMVITNNSFRPENHLVSILKVCHSTCPYINDLTISEIVTEKQLSLCSLFPDLKSVNLQCSLVSKHGLSINNFLQIRGERIQSLSLLSFSLSLGVLLKNCPNLECLTLDYPNFENIPQCDPDLSFTNLKLFNLHNFLVSEENIKSLCCIISSSPNLEELNMIRCELVDEITHAILSYPRNVRALNFSNTSVEASFLEEVLKVHKKLKILRIDNSGITPDEYDDLMDVADNLENKVHILWADYTEAIRQLYNTDLNALFRVMKRQVMKL